MDFVTLIKLKDLELGDGRRVWRDRVVRDVERVLERLVEHEDFSTEIERMGLAPSLVVREVAQDPAVLARAKIAYEPVDNLRDSLAAHKDDEPHVEQQGWALSANERRRLLAAGAAFAGWLLIEFAIGPFLWTWLDAAMTLSCFAAWIALLYLGLPRAVRNWLRWAADHARLAAGLPTRWWVIQRNLRDEVLEPELRGWLGGRASAEFSTTFTVRDTRGLMLPAGQGPLVPTAAVQACRREINRGMPAAIGIAGTRGAGKTTIIERAVGNELTDPARKPVLGVLTSAPVRYDARDFVLHVHASACRAVLNAIFTGGDRRSDSFRLWSRRLRLHVLRSEMLKMLWAVVRVAVLGLLGVAAIFLTWSKPGDHLVDRARRGVGVARELREKPREALETMPLQALAVVLILIAVLVSAWLAFRRVLLPLIEGLRVGLHELLEYLWTPRPGAAEAALATVARRHLRRIRYLQTRTSGWSGKIAGVGGFELAPTRTAANAEQPLTYPEVVDRLREFLELAGDVLVNRSDRVSTLVIAINELDKIADPAEAHSFLNDIKGIFGVRHCVFLVSVSEDALAAFERRGMAARDAFDSAFTTMLRVDPFTLEESQRWLAYRALGIPTPFVWLCHSLSGGLPRDLARVALAMHDRVKTCRTLADLCLLVVTDDIRIKCQAFVHSARQLAEQDGESDALIEYLVSLVDGTYKPKKGLVELRIPGNSASPASVRLRDEVDCYLAFCRMLLDTFTDDISPFLSTSRGALNGRSHIEALAAIRRTMAVNTSVALRALDDLKGEPATWPWGS